MTEARHTLRGYEAETGERLSFTVFIVACIAHAMDETKSLNVVRKSSAHTFSAMAPGRAIGCVKEVFP